MAPGRLAGVDAAVALDALLADLLGHGLLVGDRVLVEAHALLRDGALLDDGGLLLEDDLVLLLGDRRAVHRVVDVGVGDRLALDAQLLTLHGDGLLDLLGHDVLAQPRAAGLAALGPDAQLLLGARHRVVGGRTAGVVADGAAAAGVAVDVDVLTAAGVEAALAVVAQAEALGAVLARPLAVVAATVVLVQALLLLGRQLAVGVEVRRVLDLALLVRQAHRVALGRGLLDRDEAHVGAEEPGLDRRPLGLAGLTVEVDVLDRADLVAVAVDGLHPTPGLNVLKRRHVAAPPLVAEWVLSTAVPDTSNPGTACPGPVQIRPGRSSARPRLSMDAH